MIRLLAFACVRCLRQWSQTPRHPAGARCPFCGARGERALLDILAGR